MKTAGVRWGWGGEGGGAMPSLLLFPPCGIKLILRGSAVMHHRAGKQTGPASSNRGSCSAGRGALGVNQS